MLQWGLTIVAFLVSYAVLSVLAGILLVITNTLYMCYILDLDHQETFTPGGNAGRLTQGVPRGPTGPLGTPSRTPWTLSDKESAMGNPPALVPGPLARL